MKCGYCGKTIRDNAVYCAYCGHNIKRIQDEKETVPASSYLPSLLTLMSIALIILAGSLYLLSDGIRGRAVSDSDSVATVAFPDGTRAEDTLVGQWHCTDPAAADYTSSDYGVEVDILLTLSKNGKFTLRYRMSDAGVPALDLSVKGDYTSDRENIAFRPDSSGKNIKKFLQRHGATPQFAYQLKDDTLTLTYENGDAILFTRAD